MVKIVIDADYGLSKIGNLSSEEEQEWITNNKVVQATIEKLKTYEDVEVLRVDDPTGKTDISLKTRTERATEWKADVYVTIHHNKMGENGVYHGSKTYPIKPPFHPRILKAMGSRNQSKKQANFYVLRENAMPAILTEGGFMDHLVDIIKLHDYDFLIAEGEAIADGLAAYIKLQPKSEKSTQNEMNSILYKPTSKELIGAATIVLHYLESSREGVIPDKWLERIHRGKLTESDAIGLLYVTLHQWLSN